MYNVLIIDDEQLIGDGVKAKLERAGLSEILEIHVACSGAEGIEAAAALKPHIVITDMRMPDIDGIQVIRRLTAELPKAKFIMLSGFGDYAYVREAFKYGALDYLLKPAGSAELAKQIRAAIAAIKEDDKQAALAKRSRQGEQMLLASRLNALLNEAAPYDSDESNGTDRTFMESFFIHASAAVAMFQIGGPLYNAYDLAFVEASLERLVRNAGQSDEIQLLAFHDGNGIVCALINFSDHVPPETPSSLLRDTVRELREGRAEQAIASVSESGRLADLPKLYRQARLAMSYRILREPCDVLHPQHPPKRQEERLPARKDIEELRQAVETLQLERIDVWIDRWLPDSLIANATLEQLKAIYDLLLTEIQRQFSGRLLFEENEQAHAFAIFHSLGDLRKYLKGYVYNAKQIISENTGLDGTVIAFAESFVREHFNRDLQLAEVANRVSMNYSYFSKLFKERTGLTFTAYLIKVRMEEAQKLLKDPTLRINEISEKVGYGNLYHFSRAFKNHAGISPKEYRRTR